MQFRCANCSSRLVVNDANEPSMFRISSKAACDPDTSYSLVLDLNQLEEARPKHNREGIRIHVESVTDKTEDDQAPPSKAQTLARIFELASDETQIDHPLCADCAGQVRLELEDRTAEVQHEIEDYQFALLRLAKEGDEAMDEEQFEKDIGVLDAEIQREEDKASDLQKELAHLNNQLAVLKDNSEELNQMEQRYWLNYNRLYENLHFQLEERERLKSKLERNEEMLTSLKQTDVYNDIFQIWHEGIFGTISGLRLGQTRDDPVEWEEINAAWGQALLLLQTLSQDCKFEFSHYRLHAQGSRSSVSDQSNSYQLFGPPTSKLLSSSFDKAMLAFLACMKEFEDFAKQCDLQSGKETLFDYPFEIEGDKVGTLSIKYTLNNKAKWTKALKYMLTNLKWLMKWFKESELHTSYQVQTELTTR